MRLLIAARGEAAIRVAKAARELGWEVAAVTTPDDPSPHTRAAHVTVTIPSYTDTDSIIEAAQRVSADVIHPGYGFLAESPGFAEKVLAAGIAWAGPPPAAMKRLGDKLEAKRLAEKLHVPTPPSCHAPSPGDAERCTEKLGAPVILKASTAGGGRGMRIAHSPEEARRLHHVVTKEAAQGFGDPGEVVVEKLIPRARHVEVQVFGRPGGPVVHLYERECSIQRRRQKILEEAPSPLAAKNPGLRARLLDYALRLAEAAGYENAGTVEFIVSPSGEPYFIEANTRLQVEHGVTEQVTGIDIVKLQLQAALGKDPGPEQEEVRLHGWAIEARLYAENPWRGFAPTEGRVTKWRPPAGPWIRVDHALEEGTRITPRYDTLLAKIITYGRTRTEALQRLRLALNETIIAGVETNLELLRVLLDTEWLRNGDAYTTKLEEALPQLLAEAARRRTIASLIARRIHAPQHPQAAATAAALVTPHGWPRPPRHRHGWP